MTLKLHANEQKSQNQLGGLIFACQLVLSFAPTLKINLAKATTLHMNEVGELEVEGLETLHNRHVRLNVNQLEKNNRILIKILDTPFHLGKATVNYYPRGFLKDS